MTDEKMRRFKKTSIEQLNVLKAEMAVHPAAAQGYRVGANRPLVDAEWREIVEKLNTVGPPYRTLTEWKKVWSDYRLRNLKRFSQEFISKPKKAMHKSKKKKKFSSFDIISCSEETEQSQNTTAEFYNQDPFVDDEHNSSKEQYFNASKQSLEENEEFYPNNYKAYYSPANETNQSTINDEKSKYLDQTLSAIELQIRNQNVMMEHLTKITSRLSELMERHVVNLEKQNKIKERELIEMDYHNMLLRRLEGSRKLHTSFQFQK